MMYRANACFAKLDKPNETLCVQIYTECTKRPVNMLSTMHSQPEIESISDQKPSTILFYKKTKGGVDTLDRMVRSYSKKPMT